MSTPALARATEEVSDALRGFWEPDGQSWPARLARAAVSVALHDPDDDVIARTIHAHRLTFDPRAPLGYHCTCGAVDESEGGHSVHVADAVRAAILGEVA